MTKKSQLEKDLEELAKLVEIEPPEKRPDLPYNNQEMAKYLGYSVIHLFKAKKLGDHAWPKFKEKVQLMLKMEKMRVKAG